MNFVVAGKACSAASATVKPIFWLEDILTMVVGTSWLQVQSRRLVYRQPPQLLMLMN